MSFEKWFAAHSDELSEDEARSVWNAAITEAVATCRAAARSSSRIDESTANVCADLVDELRDEA